MEGGSHDDSLLLPTVCLLVMPARLYPPDACRNTHIL